MDSNDYNDVSEKVNQAIECTKKFLTWSGNGLLTQEKRKIDTIFEEDIREKCTSLWIREKGNIIIQEE